MVLLHVKRGSDGEDLVEFIYEAPHDSKVSDVTANIARMHTSIVNLSFVCNNVRSLAKYGPMRPEEHRSLELEDEKCEVPDPDRIRIGNPPAPEAVQTLEKVALDAESLISRTRVASRKVLTHDALDEAAQMIRGAIMIAYPMNLPEFDVLRQWMDNRLDFTGTYMEKKIIPTEHACLWFAGKKWSAEEVLSKYVGRNDKTKVIVRLQRVNAGAPVREPTVDKDTQKSMMAYWHRKQEEEKRLKEDSNDSYLHSDWANPNQLKEHFTGTTGIKWRPG